MNALVRWWSRRAASRGTHYDVFLSYRHLDRQYARAIQSALYRLGKPFWKIRAMSVFRDEDTMAVNEDLAATIKRALENSAHFVLVASPRAVESQWVHDEIAFWRGLKPERSISLIVVDGTIAWSKASEDFHWDVSSAVPLALKGRFSKEPSWADLRELKATELSLATDRFHVEIRKVAAAVRNKTPEEIASEELREYRRTLGVAWGAAAIFAGLMVLLLVTYRGALHQQWLAQGAAVEARIAAFREQRQAKIAEQNRKTAESERDRAEKAQLRAEEESKLALARQLAAQAVAEKDEDIALAARFGLAASAVAETFESRTALLATVQRHPRLRRLIDLEPSPGGAQLNLSGDGRYVVVRRIEPAVPLKPVSSTAEVWDVLRGTKLDLPWRAADVTDVAFAHSPDLWAVGFRDGRIALWDRSRASVSATFTSGFATGPQALAFDPTDRLLVASDGLGAVVLDTRTGKPITGVFGVRIHMLFATTWLALTAGGLVFNGGSAIRYAATPPSSIDFPFKDDAFTTMSLSPNGDIVSVGRKDGSIEIWSLGTGKQLDVRIPGDGEEVLDLVFSRDGTTLVSLSVSDRFNRSYISRWNTTTGARIGSATEGPRGGAALVASDDCSRVVGLADSRLWVWDIAVPHVLATPLQAGGDRLRWSRATQDGSVLLTHHENGAVRLMDPHTGRLRRELLPPGEYEIGAADADMTPDGRRVAIRHQAAGEQTLRIWTMGVADPVILPAEGFSAVALSPNGGLLAFNWRDRLIVWNIDEQRVVARFPAQPRNLLRFIRRGHAVLAADHHSFRVADLDTKRVVKTDTPTLVLHALSNDGSTLAAVDSATARLLYIYDTTSATRLARPLQVGSPAVRSIALNGDGALVVTGTNKGTLLLWDRRAQRVAVELSGHATDIASVAVSSDGTRILSREKDSPGVRWNLDASTVHRAACAVASRNFSKSEWSAFVPNRPVVKPCRSADFWMATERLRVQ